MTSPAQPPSGPPRLPAHVQDQIRQQRERIIKLNDEARPYLLRYLEWLVESIWRREYPGRKME